MTEFSIRDARPDEADAIEALILAAFEASPRGHEDETEVANGLRAAGSAVIELVAEAPDGRLVGHVVASTMQAPEGTLGLGPVSAAPDLWARGIGGALVRSAIDRARMADWDGIFVFGDPAYYTRFGFDPARAEGYDTIFAGPYLMALDLRHGALTGSGPLRYAETFYQTGSDPTG